MPVATFLGCCMSQNHVSGSDTTSIKVTKNVKAIKPSYVEV